MRIVSNAMLIISGVYLTLGLIYLRFWWAERTRLAYLAFTISCFSYTLFTWFELGMMKASTGEEYLFYLWWDLFPGTVAIISMAWIAYIHLHGRKWLFVTFAALRILVFILNLIIPNGVHFRQVTSVGSRNVLGEMLSYPIAVPNPWMAVAHLSQVLLVIFFVDTCVRCWRRGERRQALTFGVGTVLFGATVLAFAPSVLWGLAPIPIMSSFAALFIIAPTLYELNYDMHRAAMLSEELEERDARLTDTLEQLQLSAVAANVGMWTRKIGEDEIWVSEKAGEIWGFPRGQQFTRADLFDHIHPDDRDRFGTIARELEAGKNEFQLEYRVLEQNGNIRWVHSRGKVEALNGSRLIRGAVVDISKLKTAEMAIHELSSKLMDAQEKERARLARELHDDLSQSIALLAIRLASLRNEPKDIDYVKDQLDRFVYDVQRLTFDVHRISHELHPAKLTQLGLEASLRGFCRELTAAHSLEIDFESKGVPRDLPPDVSLCLYRVTQECLQNIIKHSGAARACVTLGSDNGEVRLSVSDNGKGFDMSASSAKEGLGLISIDERVRAVKGTFCISSQPGAGTKSEVRVPVIQLDRLTHISDDGTNNNSKVTIKSNRIRVFVADDSEPMLETIVGLLTPHFEIVGTAGDGQAALEMIDQLKPDIAVLDVSMPFKTGIEIAADLKTIAPEVKVVIISAHEDESYVDAAHRAGVLAYVVKSRMVDGLVPAVRRTYAENSVLDT